MGAFDHLENFPAYVDIKGGVGRIMGNQKVYKMLLQTFIKSTYQNQMKEDLAKPTLTDAAATAHAVKGMAANLSLIALQNDSTALEAELKAGAYQQESADKFAATWDTTVAYVGAVLAEMENSPLIL